MDVPKVFLALSVLCDGVKFHGSDVLLGNHPNAINLNQWEYGILIVANVKFDTVIAAAPTR